GDCARGATPQAALRRVTLLQTRRRDNHNHWSCSNRAFGGSAMRGLLSCLLCVCLVSVAAAQEKKPGPPPARFGITADLETYSQGTAKQTLQSIAKALDRKRIEYVLAHLTDPSFVDEKVDSLGGKFDVLVQQT